MPSRSDARGPRFGAAITATLLLVTVFLALIGTSVCTGASLGERVADPAFLLLTVITILFAWGFLAPRTAPWSALFRAVVRPRLGAVREWEDPRPPRFAQLVGFVVAAAGIVLHIAGVPWALVTAAAAAFLAAFLNAAFAFCLGCQIYLGLARIGLIRPAGGVASA